MKKILLLICAITLSGCAVTNFLDKVSTEKEIYVAVNKQFSGNKFNLNLIDTKKALILSGFASNKILSNEIEDLVSSMSNKEIINKLKITSYYSLFDSTYDSRITSSVKGKLLLSKEIPSTKIKVITFDKEVFLLMPENIEYKESIINIVKSVNGIKTIYVYYN